MLGWEKPVKISGTSSERACHHYTIRASHSSRSLLQLAIWCSLECFTAVAR